MVTLATLAKLLPPPKKTVCGKIGQVDDHSLQEMRPACPMAGLIVVAAVLLQEMLAVEGPRSPSLCCLL
eukprot:777374-Amphidinium_carterae.1